MNDTITPSLAQMSSSVIPVSTGAGKVEPASAALDWTAQRAAEAAPGIEGPLLPWLQDVQAARRPARAKRSTDVRDTHGL